MPSRLLPFFTLLVLAAAGCTRAVPPDPQIGFAEARALPSSATLDEMVAAGGRVLGGEAIRGIVAILSEDRVLRAIGGRAQDELLVRPDGALCIDEIEAGDCRRVVADGESYRIFAMDGEPLGTLTPARG